MGLTELALKNKLSTYLLVALMCVFGVMSYLSAEKAEDPGYTVKTAVITTRWAGATPDQMAELVSKKIEQEVRTLDSLDYVYSKNTPGESNIYVNLKAKYWDTFEPFQELMNKVSSFVVLPPDATKPIVNIYFSNIYGTILTIQSDTVEASKLYEYSEELKKELFFYVPEIAEVKIYGKQNEIVSIDIDNEKLVESGITLSQITKTLQEANLMTDGGTIQYIGNRVIVNPSGTFKSVDQIGDVVFYNESKKGRVYLKELATIKRVYETPQKLKTYSQDKQAIVLGVALSKGSNIIELKKGVEKTVAKFQEKLPLGVDISFAYNQGSLVQDKISGFIASLLQAIIVIIAVMFLFLGLKTGLIVASLTPTSIAATFIAMSVFGYGVNQMTLAGLIIALGMLVDTAVVMTENITVLCQKGVPKKEACIKSANSLAIPLLSGAATTCAAMIPIIVNKETMGQYVGPMAIVVIISLAVSWAINQTFVPMVCDDFLDPTQSKVIDYETDNMYIRYRSMLIFAVKNKKTMIMISLGTFFLGIFLFSFINKNFLPDSDNPTMATYIRMPKGSSIETTEEVVKDLNQHIKDKLFVGDIKPKPPTPWDYLLTGGITKVYEKDGILGWLSYIGAGGPKFTLGYTPEVTLPEFAFVLTKVTDYKLIPSLASDIHQFLQEKYPSVSVSTKGLQTGPMFEWDMSYVLSSSNKKALNSIKKEIMDKFRETEGVRIVNEVSGNTVPEIEINIDYNKAQLAGITTKQIAEAIKFTLKGYDATIFYDFDAPPENTMIPVKMNGTKDYKDKAHLLGSIILQNEKGQKVPLQQVAKLDIAFVSNMVYKKDMEHAILINVGNEIGYTGTDINNKIKPWIDERMANSWSQQGVKFELNDVLKTSKANSEGVMGALPIAILVIALIVIIQFNSIKKGMIIMASIPLTILGCAVGLLATGLDFGFMPMVGMISLAGVIVNQAIIMLDTYQILEETLNGDIKNAMIIGSQDRLRPILLTTYTTLIGLLPLYLFGGPLFEGLAAVLIVGLIFGTGLTLVIIPALFSIVFKVDFSTYEYKGTGVLETAVKNETIKSEVE